MTGTHATSLITLPPMYQPLFVDTTGVQAVATQPTASADELGVAGVPAKLGLSCHAIGVHSANGLADVAHPTIGA